MKILKFGLSMLLYFCLLSFGVFAMDISISTSSQEFDINDPIILQVDIVSDGGGEVAIQGFKNMTGFDIVGQQQSQSYQNVNGNVSAKMEIAYVLKAKKKGDYQIGPLVVRYGNEEVLSNVLRIKITGEKIFIGNNGTLNKNSLKNSLNKKNINKKVKKEFSEIRGLKSNFGTKFFYPILTFVVILVVLLVFYKSRFMTITDVKNKKEHVEQRLNYKKLIEDIEKKYIDSEKSVFYAKLLGIFRTYIANEFGVDLFSKTLEESRKYLPKEYLELFQKIYYPEYDLDKDSKNDRKKIIESLLFLCK